MKSLNTPSDPSPADNEDLRWIQATLRGDVDSFQHIVSKYHVMVYDLARRMLGQAEEAEDVTQEAFLRAFRKLSTYKLAYKFSTWLYTVSLNVIRNRLRRKWLRTMLSLDAVQEDNPSYEPAESFLNPEESIENKQMGELVETMLKALKPDWREVFLLHYVKNMSCKEVGNVVGISEESVKIRLFRSRQFLQQKFKSELKGIL